MQQVVNSVLDLKNNAYGIIKNSKDYLSIGMFSDFKELQKHK